MQDIIDLESIITVVRLERMTEHMAESIGNAIQKTTAHTFIGNGYLFPPRESSTFFDI